MLLFFYVYLLFERWRDWRYSKSRGELDVEKAQKSRHPPKLFRPLILSRAGYVHNEFVNACEKSWEEEREADMLRPYWRPWQVLLSITMWIALLWNLVVVAGLEAWMRLTLASAEQGDTM